jgi:ABC transport system ATP-binding/permease protein
MAPPLLRLDDVSLSFGGTPLLEGVELSVSAGERLCLVGRNGSGKSTLLKIAAGFLEPDRGERFLQPGVTLRYLPQEPDFAGFDTVLAYVEAGLAPGDESHRAAYLLGQLGLTGAENPRNLSGGEARRAALARTLAPEPDILLLDEPTNHLDLAAIEWLETELSGLRSAIVMISHDRRFLENLSGATVWLAFGQTHRLEQGFGAFEEWRDDFLERAEQDRHKLDRKIAREEEWIKYGVTARRKRNQGRLRALQALRQARRDQKKAPGSVALTVGAAEVSGKLVIEATGISKALGGRTVVREFSARILRGDRVGIIGPNGAGKTTLMRMLTGALAPESGAVRLGANLETIVIDQKRDALDPDESLIDTLTGGRGDTVFPGGKPKHVMSYLKDFLFLPEQARTPVGRLSGGERGRLMLATAFLKSSNLLVLDEPTNDFDIETLDLLQEVLADYAGTVLLISHDRDFLDRVVTSVIAFEGDGRWIDYAGGYSDMLAQRGGAPARPAKPVRPGKQAKAAVTGATGPSAKRKLSFKEKHALETLPKRLAGLEEKIAGLQKELADPGLYSRDRTRFETASAALTEAQTALAALEDDWLALELLREELGAG